MNQPLNQISRAYDIISTIPVTGESVEKMSTARILLRRAYQELERINNEKAKQNEPTKPNEQEVTDNG